MTTAPPSNVAPEPAAPRAGDGATVRVGIVTAWFERGAAMVSRAYRDVLSPKVPVFIYARGGERAARGDRDWDGPEVTWGPRLGWRPRRRDGTQGGAAVCINDLIDWARRERLTHLIFNEEYDFEAVQACRDAGFVTCAYIDYYTRAMIPEFDAYEVLFCNTRRHRSAFPEHPGAHYLPWGTDTGLFRPSSERTPPPVDAVGWPFEAEARRPVRFFHSGGFGGINLRKGTDYLVAAFAQVRGDAELVLHLQEASCFPAEVRRAPERDPRVRVVEGTATAPGLFHLGDVYVYPTRLEGIGLTILEALACGLPVITTDAGPMNEFVAHERTGRLVRVAEERVRHDGYFWPESHVDVEDLAAQMQWYVDHRERVAEHQRAARAAALAERDWAKNGAAVLEVLRRHPSRPYREPGFVARLRWALTANWYRCRSLAAATVRRVRGR